VPGLDVEGVVDTGFTGFIQIPIELGFALKLQLESTSQVTLADGSTITQVTVLAKAKYEGLEVTGAVGLAGSPIILLGMDFLRQFHLSLIVAREHVILMPEDWVEQALDEQKKTQPQPTVPAPVETAMTTPIPPEAET